VQAAFHNGSDFSGNRKFGCASGSVMAMWDRLDNKAVECDLCCVRGLPNFCLRADQYRFEQTLVPNLYCGQNRVWRARVHDRRADRWKAPRLLDECGIAIMPVDRNVGEVGLGPFHLSVGSEDGRRTRHDLLTLLIGADRLKQHNALRPLLLHGHGRGDRVMWRNGLQKFQILFEVDRTGSGQPCAEHSRHQRSDPHPVSHDMTRQTGRSEGCIQMRGIDVPRNLGKQINVITCYDAYDGRGVAHPQFIKSSVSEHCRVHRITFVILGASPTADTNLQSSPSEPA
jgi:hypothetical protein